MLCLHTHTTVGTTQAHLGRGYMPHELQCARKVKPVGQRARCSLLCSLDHFSLDPLHVVQRVAVCNSDTIRHATVR